MERRALYNSLRQNWLMDPSLSVEPWQVEDYRGLPLETLFHRLKLQDIALDKAAFLAVAEEVDTPEELTDALLAGMQVDETTHDQVHLLVFELWRRLLPEKPSLTIFCDELDHLIAGYDIGNLDNPIAIEDVLSNLQVILEEHADAGGDPVELFESICGGCANDLESFLYDFIAEQIDQENISYATELLEAFSDYVSQVKWFDFLKAQALYSSDPASATQIMHQLIKDASSEKDLEFNLELLSFLVSAGDQRDFTRFVKKTAALLESEGDFRDLISICIDFYHRLDEEETEHAIQNIFRRRSGKDLTKPFDQNDPDLAELFKAMAFRLNAID